MKAAIYRGAGRIHVDDVAEPTAGPGEIVVAMTACGLCGSDLMRWYQDPRAPTVLGHEPVGVVVQAGDGAPYRVGTRVYVHHHVPCGSCDLCRRGRDTLCPRFRETALDPGGLAERFRVPSEIVDRDVLELPDEVDDLLGTLIEPVACIVRGQRRAVVGPGSFVAVIGAGSMGLLQIQVAFARGASKVVVTDPDPHRASRAAALGAVVADGVDAASVRAALNGTGADQVFVCTHATEAIAESIHMAGPAGVVQLFAVPEPGHRVPIDLGAVFFREVMIESTYSAGPADTREALALISAGAIDADSVITHRVSLDEVARAYSLAESGEALKVVVTTGSSL